MEFYDLFELTVVEKPEKRSIRRKEGQETTVTVAEVRVKENSIEN